MRKRPICYSKAHSMCSVYLVSTREISKLRREILIFLFQYAKLLPVQVYKHIFMYASRCVMAGGSSHKLIQTIIPAKKGKYKRMLGCIFQR